MVTVRLSRSLVIRARNRPADADQQAIHKERMSDAFPQSEVDFPPVASDKPLERQAIASIAATVRSISSTSGVRPCATNTLTSER